MSAQAARISRIARLVAFVADHALLVAGAVLLLGLGGGAFVLTHFSLNSETEQLISGKVPWRQREAAFNRLFQPEGEQIVIVVDGATPELADEAADALALRLESRPDLFHLVVRPDAGPYFEHEGLLFQSLAAVRAQMAQLVSAQPFLGPLASDPSLRGLAGALSTAVGGVSSGQASLAQLNRPIDALGGALDAVRAGRPAFFSWRALISGKPSPLRERRHIILATPVLNYDKLLSGADPTAFIRHAAHRLSLDKVHGVTVRLTGPVPLQDEEFATLGQGAGLIASIAGGAILLMLWFAVRSPRLIGAIVVTTLVGLVLAAANGLLIFHRFNVISVAFIPLFVGLGIDFGIQFSVRFGAEHHDATSVRDALVAAGGGMGRSLLLAATAIASGFLAFAPTEYVGVSQLGIIAGLGMFIALALNLTLLPALVRLLGHRPGSVSAGVPGLERLDGVILGHRRLVLGLAAVAALAGAAAIPFLQFDFNTLHMKSRKVESVATLLDLMKDPDESPDTMEVITPDLAAANALAARLARLPQVAETRTLSSFVPTDQPEKLAAISDAKTLLDLTLDPIVVQPPPSDAQVAAALRSAAGNLRAAATGSSPAAAAPALRLAADFDWLAAAPPAARAAASRTFIPGLQGLLAQLRTAFDAAPVTVADVPDEIRRDWIAPDGRARVSAVPRGDSNDDRVLTRFIAAVVKVAPGATGAPYDIEAAGHTVQGAFIEAGALSFVAITLLLFAVLRRARDVAITMAPIVLTGLLTLGSCVLIGQPLNFANIVALPLLFGIGVAFHIYFVMAWRAGGSHLLQSSLSRAVFFSALATATGFGSLWASSHPGTASMGKLLMISLLWTLVSALLFQPALMGPPPKTRPGE